MPPCLGREQIRGKEGVEGNFFQGNPDIFKDMGVVFQIMAEKGAFGALEKISQCFFYKNIPKRSIARDVGGLSRSCRKPNSDQFCKEWLDRGCFCIDPYLFFFGELREKQFELRLIIDEIVLVFVCVSFLQRI